MRRIAIALSIALLAAAADAAVGVGDRLTELTLTTRDGKPLRLAELGGRVVVLDFWASWCVPCTKALPRLDEIARRHADAGLVVVAVGIDKGPEVADRFLAARLPHPAMTMARDPDGALLARLGAKGMPALYLLDRKGIVRLVEGGYEPSTLDAVEAAIEKLLAAPRE